MDRGAGIFGPSPAEDRDQEIDELSRLADELVEQIGAARRHYSELRATAEHVVTSVGPDDEPGAPAEESPREEAHSQPSVREEAELVALNMALSGGDRSEAQRQIADTFGIQDPTDILDTAFGDSDAPASPPRRRFARLRRH